jgi:hypothetical protein
VKVISQKFIYKEKHIMENQDHVPSITSPSTSSREELEQHLRARAWKDDAFRQEFLTHPKAILERDYAQYFPGSQIPSELSIKVVEEEEQSICLVLPPKLSDEQLSELEPIDDKELLSVAGGNFTESSGCGTATNNCMTCRNRTCFSCAICKHSKLVKNFRL